MGSIIFFRMFVFSVKQTNEFRQTTFTSLKIIIWDAIVNENNKDSNLSGTRSYEDHLRTAKNSLVID